MKYTVKKNNDFFFDVYVNGFNLIRLDLEDIDVDIPANGPLNISERQVHKSIEMRMNELSGTWYLGELRITDFHGNYSHTARDVTRTDLNDSEFTAKEILIAEGGKITISEFNQNGIN